MKIFILLIVIVTLTFLKKAGTLLRMTDGAGHQAAISAALAQNWKEAISINSAILGENEADTDALNRLGFAYLRTGQMTKAKRTYQKVLKLDPYNQIAIKNSKKLTSSTKTTEYSVLSPLLFLEEPGKTKIVSLVNTAPSQTLSSLTPGQEVFLKAKNHCVEIRTTDSLYLGALPDDLSFKLIKLLSAGNTYRALVKAVGKNMLTVLLREISRGKRFINQPSFVASSGAAYTPFSASDNKATERPDVTPTGEDEEEPDKGTEETNE